MLTNIDFVYLKESSELLAISFTQISCDDEDNICTLIDNSGSNLNMYTGGENSRGIRTKISKELSKNNSSLFWMDDGLEHITEKDFLDLEFLNIKPFKVNLPLGQRKDVMNKALLRTIKRFFVLKFKSIHSSPLCKSKSRKASISKRQMSDYYLELSKNAVGMPTDRNQAYTAAIIQKILEA
jgi:hypothetical protein